MEFFLGMDGKYHFARYSMSLPMGSLEPDTPLYREWSMIKTKHNLLKQKISDAEKDPLRIEFLRLKDLVEEKRVGRLELYKKLEVFYPRREDKKHLAELVKASEEERRELLEEKHEILLLLGEFDKAQIDYDEVKRLNSSFCNDPEYLRFDCKYKHARNLLAHYKKKELDANNAWRKDFFGQDSFKSLEYFL